MYVLTPHNYVALALAARFSELGARRPRDRDVIFNSGGRSTVYMMVPSERHGRGAWFISIAVLAL
jgi:hypothetical protein